MKMFTFLLKSIGQPQDCVLCQVLLSLLSRLSACVDDPINGVGDLGIAHPKDFYATLGRAAWHVLQKLASSLEWHKLLTHSETIPADEHFPTVDHEQVPRISEGCHVV